MAEIRTAPRHGAPTHQPDQAPLRVDPRWRNDASFTLLVASLLLMVLTLVFWVS